MNSNSDKSMVMKTVCTRCGGGGYIFPDQLERFKEVRPGNKYWAKCCNGRHNKRELLAECKGYINQAKAVRLQKIRRRKTTIDPNQAVANF